ncbi:uncharacterized protein EHS24_001566 [Apiotrichum porosum]|uniref:ABM domain-containing protein n=1 Tax=Apiotrichum porosum TaxID=105984 RepID=A0A427XL83_9TREE|nr:uncharacterized protein EHS24_001566 [Apiotrichum porosum]RSH79514.1 hypothetical protein EHS24_001566 [Apiotrichum porosum]
MLNLLASLTAVDEAAAAKIAALLQAVKANTDANEAGNHKYEITQNGLDFNINELYDDMAAIEVHKASPQFVALVKDGDTLIKGGMAGLKIEVNPV